GLGDRRGGSRCRRIGMLRLPEERTALLSHHPRRNHASQDTPQESHQEITDRPTGSRTMLLPHQPASPRAIEPVVAPAHGIIPVWNSDGARGCEPSERPLTPPTCSAIMMLPHLIRMPW